MQENLCFFFVKLDESIFCEFKGSLVMSGFHNTKFSHSKDVTCLGYVVFLILSGILNILGSKIIYPSQKAFSTLVTIE